MNKLICKFMGVTLPLEWMSYCSEENSIRFEFELFVVILPF